MLKAAKHLSAKNIFVAIGALVSIGGILIASFLVQNNQDVRNQAYLGNQDVDIEKLCLGPECDLELVQDEEPGIFVSDKNSFEVSYSADVWQRLAIPETASKKDTDNAFYILRDNLSFATIYLNAVELEDSLKGKTLAEVGQILEKEIIKFQKTTAGETTYIGKETVVVANIPALKLTYKESTLGYDAYYYEYVLLGPDHYLEVEVKTTGTGGVDQNVAQFMNGIKLRGVNQVRGAESDKEATLDEAEITEIVKPSVGNVLYLYCKEVVIKPGTTLVMKPSYEYCSGAYGSGFIISGDGLFATNGHVVMTHPEQSLIEGLINNDKNLLLFLVDLVRELAAVQGVGLSLEQGALLTRELLLNPASAQGLIKGIYSILDRGIISINNISEKHFVNLGDQPFSLLKEELSSSNINSYTYPSDTIFAAKIIGVDFANSYTSDVLFNDATPQGSDVAVLQIEAESNYDFPSLKIGTVESIAEGDSILILGFPGAVRGSDRGASLLDYENSSTKVTVTKGIVSSIKEDKEGRNLIQTDASIGHGNSGGPAFNSAGEVVGLATYGIKDAVGSFNFLRDVADLQNLADKEGLADQLIESDSYRNWATGLKYFWQSRYSKSLESLAMVEDSYPVHPEVKGVIDEAQQAIADGKDVDLLFGVKKEFVYIGGGGGGLLAIGAVTLLVRKSKKKKASIARQTPVQESNLQQPVVQSTSEQPLVVPQSPTANQETNDQQV